MREKIFLPAFFNFGIESEILDYPCKTKPCMLGNWESLHWEICVKKNCEMCPKYFPKKILFKKAVNICVGISTYV